MKKSEFYYDLPECLIAQEPNLKRSDCRLLVVHKKTGLIEEKKFYDIIDYLKSGDALVINDSKVIPARLIGKKIDTHATIEVLLLKNIKNNIWECLTKPQKRLHEGSIITFGDGSLKGEVIKIKEDGITHINLLYDGILMEVLERLGSMPTPPYIHKKLEKQDMYQTVYAEDYGSSAAPTAGLHFTKELLNEIEKKGIKIVHITLHVGLGTFRPVLEDDILDHKMHYEEYIIDDESAKTLNEVKKNGGRIFAVGTTSTRTLEANLLNNNEFRSEKKDTNIFIYPGYKFKAIDALITNFHLPESTLIMLVSAFLGKEKTFEAYNFAVKNKYQFFSFGDAMLIID